MRTTQHTTIRRGGSRVSQSESGDPFAAGTTVDDIRTARQELDAVIAEIRQVPGYGDFLAPPTFDDVAHAAHESPLVYLVAADVGGTALVVRDTDIAEVPLDRLTDSAVHEHVQAHFAVYDEYRADRLHARSRWSTALDRLTAWLWDVAMGPVLAEVGDADEVAIVAGGLLGLVPLHAAWTGDRDRPTGRYHVLDAMPVTYAPNARTLSAARATATQMSATRLLAVVEPWPVRAAPLPFAHLEAAAAIATFTGQSTVLAGGEATSMSFEYWAARSDVLHLACHGFADLSNPLDSGLLLADTSITLRRLFELRLAVRLAILSACETALPGTALPDEVVALPTGLLQAGVAGVVASQWSVPDRASAMVMTEFYRCWRSEHMAPAVALRTAQTWVRDSTNAEKVEHLDRAVDGESPWLPAGAADDLLDWLSINEPDVRSHADLHEWAAFAHVGA